MINLEQIKADIAARKAMPAWGPQTSIERIKTINATLPSFSLKTVEALVERIAELEGALEVSQGDLSDTEDAMHLWAERARKAESELESRTVTIEPFRSFVTDADLAVLHRFAECCDDPESGGHDLEKEEVLRLEAIGALRRSGCVHWITGFGDVLISITAGIRVEAGTFRENENSSTVYFREISETSTKGGNQ
ncbi:hypothetical protein [Klebsiella variicola]|uniref:hypothetical protein n=1 Tax=Klebsiella variicola TaxID=244366 RepID=UPI0035A2C18E